MLFFFIELSYGAAYQNYFCNGVDMDWCLSCCCYYCDDDCSGDGCCCCCDRHYCCC